MLSRLLIQNYVLIEQIRLDLKSGLTCITGETGAGKSILLGALELILGKRADSKSLYDNSSKCIVEGHFDLSRNIEARAVILKYDLDDFEPCIIRREISPNGRSRAFINDTPVQLGILTELAQKLIDISSQRDALQLKDSDFLYRILDGFAGTNNELKKYTELLNHQKEIVLSLEALKRKEDEIEQERSFLEFQLNELESLNLSDYNELIQSESELNLLENAEQVKSVLFKLSNALGNNQNSLDDQLASLQNELQAIVHVAPEIDEFSKRLGLALIDIRTLYDDISRFEDGFSFSEEELVNRRNRVSVLYSALQKFRANTLEDLIEQKIRISEKLNWQHTQSGEIQNLEQELHSLNRKLLSESEKIYKKRLAVKEKLENAISKTIAGLGLEDAQFIFDLPHPENNHLNKNACGTLRILFSANAGSEPAQIANAASGGELSRVMLALKESIASKMALPTLIFDEIDTGISGKTAKKTAELLDTMSSKHQIIAITHLGQIAAKANTHLLVSKARSKGKTQTRIRALNESERIQQIATMISGEHSSETAIQQAKALISR